MNGRKWLVIAMVWLAVSLASVAVQAEAPAAVATPSVIQLNGPGAADRAAARNPLDFGYHIMRARTAAGERAPLNGPVPFSLPAGVAPAPPTQFQSTIPAVPSPGFYPADLSFFGGPVMIGATQVNAYIGCSNDSCWGDPVTFQENLNNARFMNVLRQYIGGRARFNFPLGPQFNSPSVPCTSPSFCSITDILAIVHQAATQPGSGSGLNHIIHVFLKQGVDTCSDVSNTFCYSPDNPATFVFCAYHFHVKFPDIAEQTFFTVEPYQAVVGCEEAPPNPNGELADSTNSTLSHETFETISDPDGNAWIANSSLVESGLEIGDVCQGPSNGFGQGINPTVLILGVPYQVQLEYSNKYHACSKAP